TATAQCLHRRCKRSRSRPTPRRPPSSRSRRSRRSIARRSAAASRGARRRRRGRRGGRRRRRGEPGQDLGPGEQAAGDGTPVAETVEYVPATSGYDDAAAEMAEALHASPAPETRTENGAESVPVAERGGGREPETAASPTEAATSSEVGGHEVSGGAPANPKRGWWRRVLDS